MVNFNMKYLPYSICIICGGNKTLGCDCTRRKGVNSLA